ncbi:hypothetical protein L198_02053 [Cryptococcus wingfieldii CBS 7118]|uniref:Uncharacterized protein n=1 Tax=Cryptococcus wingfieldii CBS 7118 TaxID=1295528 RepID=A0A1E3JWY2_9TREE|nr:hypothetical protein L198_02053 [Cryptococcus wingfieldii CBS 7118]ODO05360.1 hypothetical protein L198_02053 [Cryptococcus wingfieldii CBS 7118]
MSGTTATSNASSSSAPVIQDKMDYPSLAEGHAEPTVAHVKVVGLGVNVYGLKEACEQQKPLTMMIAAHGRMNSQKNMKYFAQGILGEVAKKDETHKKRNLVVVTLDQRNHGERIVDKTANLSFDQNPRHLIDMAATIRTSLIKKQRTCTALTCNLSEGGVHDIQLLMDFLPAYLFPHGELTVEEWVITGISLGGHVTWKLLHDDPRVQIGIPIIGLPFESLPKYLGARALNNGLTWGPPTYPPSLQRMIEPFRDLTFEQKAYSGKKILTMHGKEDKLVPFGQGEGDIKQIEDWAEHGTEKGGICAIDVQDNVGHVCTVQMLKKAAEWTWRYALVDEEVGADSALKEFFGKGNL